MAVMIMLQVQEQMARMYFIIARQQKHMLISARITVGHREHCMITLQLMDEICIQDRGNWGSGHGWAGVDTDCLELYCKKSSGTKPMGKWKKLLYWNER
jgi:hypothetical protein